MRMPVLITVNADRILGPYRRWQKVKPTPYPSASGSARRGYINGLLPTYTGLNRGDLQVILRQTFESKDSKDSYIKK